MYVLVYYVVLHNDANGFGALWRHRRVESFVIGSCYRQVLKRVAVDDNYVGTGAFLDHAVKKYVHS